MQKFKKWFHSWSWILLLIFSIGGLFYAPIGLGAIICMLAPPVGAIFNGRITCSWFCPRGSLLDVVVSKISINKKIPQFLFNLKFRLIVLIIIMTTFIIQIMHAWGNIFSLGRVFIIMISVTTIIGIILGIIFKPRAWCVFCPIGTLGNLVTRFRDNTYITINKNICTSCTACSAVCPLQFPAFKHKEEDRICFADCLRCSKCEDRCPKKALKLIKKENIKN